MPTYEYLCEKCEHLFEKFQPITSRPLRKCPECGKMKLNRLIGAGSGVIFKGSGFYETDYRSKNYTEGKKNEQPKSETGKDKKETKTKSKPKDSAKPKSPDKKNPRK